MSANEDIQNIFIVGSKGIPGSYGGYETFVDKLTEYHQNEPRLKYHIACKSDIDGEFEYHNARCFKVKVPDIGPAQAIYYDIAAFNRVVKFIKEHNIPHPIVYVLACRIGPFTAHFHKELRKLGGKLYVNPDGHEWMRAKWSAPVRKYWKISERLMVKHCDLLVCDSKNIERYIHEEYGKYDPQTTYISYGAETRKSHLADDAPTLLKWYSDKGLEPKSYYLVVGRFVPENNYETMIREFMTSGSDRDLALITNVSEKYLEELKCRTHFDRDPRIKFVGSVYDQELLMKIRENAYAYLHGHEVGGTNPSLLEALGSTDLNLLLDVGFNREVGLDTVLYWDKDPGSLSSLINRIDCADSEWMQALGIKSSLRIKDAYSWRLIAAQYFTLFNRD